MLTLPNALRNGSMVLAALVMAAHPLPAQSDDQAIEWGENAFGLQMSISFGPVQGPASLAPAITLHLRNVGDMTRQVILGEECSRPTTGARANLVAFDLHDASGKVTRLRDPGFCLAGLFLFEVSLPRGASFSTPLKLGAYDPDPSTPGAPGFVWGRDSGTLQALLTVDPGSAQRICASNVLRFAPSMKGAAGQDLRAWGETVNGLRMSISIDAASTRPSRLPSLSLALQNAGQDDLFVIVGGGCGHRGYELRPSGVKLNLRDRAGNSVTLDDLGPGPPYEEGFCAGAMAILPAELPSGATYLTPLKIDYYKTSKYSLTRKDFETGWEPGQTYSVRAVLTLRPIHDDFPPGGVNVRFGHSWAGTVTSNPVEVQFPAN